MLDQQKKLSKRFKKIGRTFGGALEELKEEGREAGEAVMEAGEVVGGEMVRGRGGGGEREEGRIMGGVGREAEERERAAVERAENRLKHVDQKLENAGKSAKGTVGKFRIPVKGVGYVSSCQVKQLLCAISAGAISGFLCSPFAALRVRVLAGSSSAAEVVRTSVRKEGFQSNLTKADPTVSLLRAALSKGIEFLVYETAKEELKKRKQQHGRSAMADPNPRVLPPPLPRNAPFATLAGAAAGLASTLAAYPIDVVLDRVLLKKEVYKGFGDGVRKIIAAEGLPGLYRGIVPAMISLVPTSALGFYTYNKLKDTWQDHTGQEHPESFITVALGAASGMVSSTLTYPLEAARKKISISALGSEGALRGGSYGNVVSALQGIVREEGGGGLYRGLTAQLLMIVPMTAISFAVYEASKRAFVAEEERGEEGGEAEA